MTDCPLAVCDYTSISKEDLHLVDTVLPHRVNEIYHLVHNPAHKWYYMSDQTPTEGILMKIYDTDDSFSKCKWKHSCGNGLDDLINLQFLLMLHSKSPREKELRVHQDIVPMSGHLFCFLNEAPMIRIYSLVVL